MKRRMFASWGTSDNDLCAMGATVELWQESRWLLLVRIECSKMQSLVKKTHVVIEAAEFKKDVDAAAAFAEAAREPAWSEVAWRFETAPFVKEQS